MKAQARPPAPRPLTTRPPRQPHRAERDLPKPYADPAPGATARLEPAQKRPSRPPSGTTAGAWLSPDATAAGDALARPTASGGRAEPPDSLGCSAGCFLGRFAGWPPPPPPTLGAAPLRPAAPPPRPSDPPDTHTRH